MKQMAFLRADQPQKEVVHVPARFVRRLSAPGVRAQFIQWVVVGIVGIVLGGYTLKVASLPAQWALLFLVAVLCPFIAMVVGNVRRLLLAIILLDIPFQLDKHFFYRQELEQLGALGGLNISLTTVALTILYALWLSELLSRRETQPAPSSRTSIPLGLYLGSVALSVGVAQDINLALFELFMLLQIFLLYIYIVYTVRTRQDVLFIVSVLMIGLLLQSLLMIALRGIGSSIEIASISARIDSNGRVGGTLGGPNSAASYLSLLLAPTLSIFLTRLKHWYKWLAALGFGLGGVALILTSSRGGWLAFILSIILLCLLAWRRGWLPLAIPMFGTFVVVLLGVSFQDVIVNRLFGSDEGSALSRVPLMMLAFQIIWDNPILGAGANNFALLIQQYSTPEFGNTWLYIVHNQYLLVWSEKGVLGLVTFIWFLIATIHQGWRCWMSKDRLLSSLALGFSVAIIGQMVHMNVDIFNGRPQTQLLWLIAGLLTAISGMREMQKAQALEMPVALAIPLASNRVRLHNEKM